MNPLSKILLLSILGFQIFLPNITDGQKIDSLKLELNKTNDPVEKNEIYLQLIDESQDTEELSTIIISALEFGDVEKNLKFNCEFLKRKCLKFNSLGIMDEALVCFDDAISFAKDNEFRICQADIMRNKSFLLLSQGKYDVGLNTVKEAVKIAESTDDDEIKAKVYNILGVAYYYLQDDNKAIESYDKTITYALRAGDKYVALTAKYNKTIIYAEKDVEKSIELYEEIVSEAKEINPSLYSKALHALTTSYIRTAQYQKAMSKAIILKDHTEKLNDKWELTNSYYVLANIYGQLEDFDQALKYIQKGKKLAIQTQSQKNISEVLAEESEIYIKLGKLEKAETCLLEGAKYIEKDTRYEAYLNLYIGKAKNSLNKHSEAKSYLEKALNKVQGKENSIEEEIKNNLAECYLNLGQESKARKLFQEVYETSLTTGVLNNKKVAVNGLYKTYKKIDPARALSYLEESFEIYDSIINLDNARKVEGVILREEFQKEKDLIALKSEQEKIQLEEKQKRTLYGGALAAFALFISLIFYNSLRKKSTLIESQKAELETLNNTKDTLFQIIGHDLKKPTIGFRSISKNINYLLEKQDYKRLQLLGEEVDQDAKSLYNLTDNLLNWALMQKDMIAIKTEKINLHLLVNDNFDLFNTLSKRKNITLVNNINRDTFALADRNALDTIVRNLIDNALKYTREEGLISVDSKIKDGIVRIIISDTGIGMKPSTIDEINKDQLIDSQKGTGGEKGSGIGLQLVKNLIEKNKGKLTIQSIFGSGSTIIMDLPLAN